MHYSLVQIFILYFLQMKLKKNILDFEVFFFPFKVLYIKVCLIKRAITKDKRNADDVRVTATHQGD